MYLDFRVEIDRAKRRSMCKACSWMPEEGYATYIEPGEMRVRLVQGFLKGTRHETLCVPCAIRFLKRKMSNWTKLIETLERV